MTKSKLSLIVVLFLLLFTLPALAQGKGKNIVRVRVPAVGETFMVTLADNEEYVVDPFEGDFTPDTEIINGDCITNYSVPTGQIGFNSHFITSAGDGSGCTLELRVLEKWDDGGDWMSFLRVRMKQTLTLSSTWTDTRIPKGSYSIAQNGPHVTAELDLDGSHANCRTATHDAASDAHRRGYGIHHVGYFWPNGVFEERDMLENRGSWYRVLEKACTLRYRGMDGDTGDLVLLKLSPNAIYQKESKK